MNKNIYVVSGGPGFGKSALIDALEKKGFYVGKDVAREFIEEQKRTGGKILHYVHRLEFNKEVLQRRIKQYKDTPENKICFFDRGIPDLIAYLVKYELKVPNEFYEAANKYKYQKTVFFTPPWQEIFENDPKKRHENFEEAVSIHNTIEKVYQELGYEIINIPKTSVSERVEFVLLKTGVEK
ncbi:AAA family ATPase [Candidatus Woesearchaeota archaeon]|nr:AAA family ATPase [Candidatus Woesearchaeota archaeon]